MARVHRIGQTKPVHMYRLCTSGTIEEVGGLGGAVGKRAIQSFHPRPFGLSETACRSPHITSLLLVASVLQRMQQRAEKKLYLDQMVNRGNVAGVQRRRRGTPLLAENYGLTAALLCQRLPAAIDPSTAPVTCPVTGMGRMESLDRAELLSMLCFGCDRIFKVGTVQGPALLLAGAPA